MYNLKSQSEQNKKEIYRLQKEIEKLDEHNKQAQEKELDRLKEEILKRTKQHNNENTEMSIKYIQELNSNFKKYGDSLKHVEKRFFDRIGNNKDNEK